MALEVAKKRRKRLTMTSLIDVIFLLLLFFMLTSTFSKFGEVELITATSGGGAKAEQVERLFLSLKPGQLLLNGIPVDLDQLRTRLSEPATDPRLVMISLSDHTTSQDLVDTLANLRGIANVKTMVLQ